MHIVIDLAACQRAQLAERHTMLAWIKDFLAQDPSHQIEAVLMAMPGDSAEAIRAALAPQLPAGRIALADFAAAPSDSGNGWLNQASEALRAAWFEARRADVIVGFEDDIKLDGERSGARLVTVHSDGETPAMLWQRLLALPPRAPEAVAEGSLPHSRLAYISPLPPEKSGIADYSAELLPQLARFFDIDVIVDQERVANAWIEAHLPIRNIEYFEAHAASYQHILYHFGNSAMHRHMFGLLERHPGVVVLHDFYLANLLHYMHHSGYGPDAFPQALYHSHGFGAVIDSEQSGENAAVWKYPCNKAVLDNATGVIVHSRYPSQLARLWYGEDAATGWQIVPLLRGMPQETLLSRAQARSSLGIAESDFVICSFGMLGKTKLNERLLDAWLASPLAQDRQAHLIFVGELSSGNYGRDLLERIARSRAKKRIRITGFASQAQYHAYLAAADVAVQLRSESRGETSASVLDCLLFGLPTIVNAHGANRELPPEVVCMLEDRFETAALTAAVMQLKNEPDERARLRQASSAYVHTVHAPEPVGEEYHRALLHFARHSAHAHYQRLLDRVAAIDGVPGEEELDRVALAIAANQPEHGPRQLLIDISAMVQSDLKTGIQRVVRSILTALLLESPHGYRVEPVYSPGNMRPYRYARAHMQNGLLVPVHDLDDAPIEMRSGDIFLGLDLMMHGVHQNRAMLEGFRDRGAEIYFVVFDLLPLLHPEFFPFGSEAGFADWMDTIATVSTGLVGISRAVADEASAWLLAHPPARQRPLNLSYFHLGADIGASVPSRGLPDGADMVLERLAARPSFLMVGTVEPRKGHAFTLSAFDRLWAEGVEANLIIVGKHGWMVDELTDRLNAHPEQGTRLFWLQGVSDEMLLKLYRGSSALLAASEGEGFGLPLIEAAQHGLPLIARSLPVFKEVAGDHAFYFDGISAEEMAGRLKEWLALLSAGNVPTSGAMPWLTWRQSAEQLVDVIIGKKVYRTLAPASAATSTSGD